MALNMVNGAFKFANGQTLQLLPLSGVRVNATAAVASTAEAALPAGTEHLVIVRATGPMAIRFGATGMGAAAVDANSILFPAGEAPVPVPSGSTHFRVIRASGSDAFVQLEAIPMTASS